MPMQQMNATNAYESAVGALLAALAQGAGTPGDAAAFQSQLASSLNAVMPQLQSQSEEQPAGSDEPRHTKVRSAGDGSRGAAVAVASPNQPQASAAASSGDATPSQDNSSSDQVSQENGSSTVSRGATATAPDNTGSVSGKPSPALSSSGSDSPKDRQLTTTAATATATSTATAAVASPGSTAGFNGNGPSQESLGAAPASDETAATTASGRGGRGAGAQKVEKAHPQASSATASVETATSAGTTGQGGSGTHAADVAALVGPERAVGVKDQTAPQNGAETTTGAATQTHDSSSAPAQPVAQQASGRAAAKTVDFQQALQGLSLQSMAVRAELAGGQTAASDAAAATGGGAAAGSEVAAVAAVGASGAQAATPAAEAEATVQTGTADQPDQAAQVEQIVRAMQSSLSRGGGRVTLQLSPPDLGKLRVQMQIRGSDLTASFDTENEASQTLLQNSLPQLREAMASQGLRLVEASVQIQGGAAQHSGGASGGWSGAGNFGPGTQAGGQQAGTGGQQHYGRSAEAEPAAAPSWSTGVEDESRVNVLV